MKEFDKIDLIEKNHRNQLSTEEQVQFDLLWQDHDDNFAAEVEEYEFLFDGFDALHAEAFQEQLQHWEKEQQAKEQAPQPVFIKPLWSRLMPYAAAAAVVLLLSPLLWQWLPQSPDSQLQALLQPAVANVLRDAGEDDPQQQLRKKALSFYNNKQYDQAITTSQQYLNQYGIGDQDIQYFLAASLYLKGEYLKANQLFDLLSQGSSTYAQEAQWMQAAVQYQLNNIPACRQLLQQILQKPDHVRYRSAKQLLEKL